MSSQEKSEIKPLDKVYQEASQWVRLVNTIIWTMGTLLVPVSFGFVGLALNKAAGAQFDQGGKVILGLGSVFLFSFWVYACRIYKNSTRAARAVLMKIEEEWQIDDSMALYKMQEPILNRRTQLFKLQIPYGLFSLQGLTLVALILVWLWILL
jgi:hypothetical protein